MKARYIIIPVLLIAATAVTVWIIQANLSNGPEYDLYIVSKGSVSKTVSANGMVTSDQKVELSFLSPGIVETVGVKVGDTVTAGDFLAKLDTKTLERQRAQASASASSASALFSKVQNPLRSSDRNVLSQSLESARVALRNAENSYNRANSSYYAQLRLIDQGLVSAQISLQNAVTALNQAQNNYQDIIYRYNMGQATLAELQQSQMALSSANSAHAMANAAYNQAVQKINVDKLGARSQLDAARAQLNGARAAYNLANAQYQQAVSNSHTADVSAARGQAAAGWASVQVINSQIEKATLNAPISGTVTAVNISPQELSSMAGPAIVIETVNELQIESLVSEVDLQKINIGAHTRILFDALADVVTSGIVAEIDPSGTAIAGVVNYKITIVLDNYVNGLKPDFSADLEILTEQRDNAIFIPRTALERKDGGYIVKVLIDDEVEEHFVELGLLGDTEAEIISGVNEGDRVVLRELS
ncbi:MAG: efflux RND transporter periplasmic adaptor subunit [Patescibacteria group bacterium]|nr:efflux RND transporter periplasmic adaptor subunit [Patescibacteria group bacterium]